MFSESVAPSHGKVTKPRIFVQHKLALMGWGTKWVGREAGVDWERVGGVS